MNARSNVPLLGVLAVLELVNLSNARYVDVSSKPVAGRSIFIGATLDSAR